MAFPGMVGMSGGTANAGLNEQEQKMVKMVKVVARKSGYMLTAISQMQSGMESCAVKSIMAGGMGFVIGGAFGMFMASVRAISPRRAALPQFLARESFC